MELQGAGTLGVFPGPGCDASEVALLHQERGTRLTLQPSLPCGLTGPSRLAGLLVPGLSLASPVGGGGPGRGVKVCSPLPLLRGCGQ